MDPKSVFVIGPGKSVAGPVHKIDITRILRRKGATRFNAGIAPGDKIPRRNRVVEIHVPPAMGGQSRCRERYENDVFYFHMTIFCNLALTKRQCGRHFSGQKAASARKGWSRMVLGKSLIS